MSPRLFASSVIAASIAAASCNTPTPIDRAAVYGEIATNVIAPSYAALRSKAAELSAAAAAYCADPSDVASFTALRSALDAAHAAYSRTNAFEYSSSPVVTMLVPVLLDGFPVYGPKETSGAAPTGLDSCNGHTHATADVPAGLYHYHVTTVSPYISGCYKGTAGAIG